MNTPIVSFLTHYAESGAARFHMPGHKGVGPGPERLDITEIPGADSLYSADGIIRESEENASRLFGARTFYSTEGSSLAIRAMLALACRAAAERGEKPLIAAGRNAHKAFLSGAVLLDFDILWLTAPGGSYLSCPLTAEAIEEQLDRAPRRPTALYLTSPDYLGHTLDIAAIASVCRAREILLLVDNAHGAYLKFLPSSRHPIDLGADLCCDSAHKTLPVLTGGAYLHVSRTAPEGLAKHAETALALFGSTSPSYLILASLDAANAALAGDYPDRLNRLLPRLDRLRALLTEHGFSLVGDEPMKLTLAAGDYGYTGTEAANHLAARGVTAEFADRDHLVLMPSVETTEEDLSRLTKALLSLTRRPAVSGGAPTFSLPPAAMRPREAALAPCETVPVGEAEGRILAAVTVGCPPAVPIAVSGEKITAEVISGLRYYGIKTISAVR